MNDNNDKMYVLGANTGPIMVTYDGPNTVKNTNSVKTVKGQ